MQLGHQMAAATLGVAMALGSGVARADEADDQRGRFHFQAGASYYEAGDYEHALREFQRAYEISKRPELNYNLSLAHQQLGNLDEAMEYLARYLEEVEEIPNRVNLERRLVNLRERADEQRAAQTETETAPEPDPDTAPVEPPTERPEPDGNATQDGFQDDVRTRPVDMAPSDEGGGVPAAAWVGWGIGAGSLVTATALGIMALNEKNDVADSPCGMAGTCSPDAIDKMDRLALLSDVFLGVGIAGAAVGTILFFTLRNRGSAEESASYASLELAPWVDPRGGAGATVGGEF